MTLSHHLLTQAYNNGWSNHRLLKACMGLAQIGDDLGLACIKAGRSRTSNAIYYKTLSSRNGEAQA